MTTSINKTNNQSYLKGFSTLKSEVTNQELETQGKFPDWLKGTLLRNGPAQFEVGNERFQHWFDGLAMVHRLAVEDGKVFYTNKFLQTPGYKDAQATSKINVGEFSTNPARNPFLRLLARLRKKEASPASADNTNVNVARIDGCYIAMTETPQPIEFELDSLVTKGVFDYGDELHGQITTAHPLYDPTRKTTYNLLQLLSRKSYYQFYGIKDGERKRSLIAKIEVAEPTYIHSFTMTANYLILVEFPLVVRPIQLMLDLKPFIQNYRWSPERGTRFTVIDKQTGEVKKVGQSAAFFAFHHINAFERDNEIFLDVAAYNDPKIIEKLRLDSLPKLPDYFTVLPEFRRYRLPLSQEMNSLDYEVLASQPIELPRINYKQAVAQDYRYAYGTSLDKNQPPDFDNRLIKVDTRKAIHKWWVAEGGYPGEPVFVARPSATVEDDGLLLSVMLDGAAGHSWLVALEAASFEEVGRAKIPHIVPFGFHGQFYSR